MKSVIVSNVDDLVIVINHYISRGFTVSNVSIDWRWRIWRWVKLYRVSFEKPKVRLDFVWGPISERPIPGVPLELE